MRKVNILLSVLLLTLSLAAHSSALTKPEMEAVSREFAEPEATQRLIPVGLSILTGQVTSIDPVAKILTVKKTGLLRRQVTFAVEGEALPLLAELKHGDWVDIGYAEADGKLIAQSIVRRMTEPGEQ